MKKTAAILCLIITCLYISGSYVAYQVRRHSIKKEVRNYLATHENVGGQFFSFKANNGVIEDERVRWKDDHEFSFLGEMYDVISLQSGSSSVVIHCIKDKEEKKLIELYTSLLEKKGESSSSANHSFKFFTQLFFVNDTEDFAFPQSQVIIHFANHSNYFSAGFKGLIEEPPKGC